jgi:hypothetical protein
VISAERHGEQTGAVTNALAKRVPSRQSIDGRRLDRRLAMREIRRHIVDDDPQNIRPRGRGGERDSRYGCGNKARK